MLRSLLKNLRATPDLSRAVSRRLHIGGALREPGWEVLNALPGSAVDHVGNARDLSRFRDGTFIEVYASHVLEHLDFTGELQAALSEWHRVLTPGGRLSVSVPDLTALSTLFLNQTLTFDGRLGVMRMIYGAHTDQYDYHKVGFDFAILRHFLKNAGFTNIERVSDLQRFDDTSRLVCLGIPISLNAIARKPGDAPQS
jgi:predicted SAM-dependent methyltransferase